MDALTNVNAPHRDKTGVLLVIVLSQLACTSLWFSGNIVAGTYVAEAGSETALLSHLVSLTQAGFITGTLSFAVLSIADRFDSRKVFFLSAIPAAAFHASLLIFEPSSTVLLTTRFLVGFFLAGIYPVGMKIAADHYPSGLGSALGFLVGALVLGTASPHLINFWFGEVEWQYTVAVTCTFAVAGGVAILTLPKTIQSRKQTQWRFADFLEGFRSKDFRAFAFGYFGHMWELYTFWTFVPLIVGLNGNTHNIPANISAVAFIVIASGAIGCVVGGLISRKLGESKVAFAMLFASCLCCLLSPLAMVAAPVVCITFLLLWGITVVGDSPLFSALVARSISPELRGSALTIVTCIGFAITVISIYTTRVVVESVGLQYSLPILVIGPIFGLISIRKYLTRAN